MKVDFRWNRNESQILNLATGGNGTQLFIANEAKKLMDPYVPMRFGFLHKNVSVGADSGGGYVHYKEPYANFQYYGIVMTGVNSHSPYAKHAEKKETKGRKIKHSTARHPLATSEWDKAMKVARMNDLIRATENYIKRGGSI